MSAHYRRDRTESLDSTTYECRQAWVEHNMRFRPKLTEFRTATLELCTPAHLKSKSATDKATKQHAKNSFEYFNGSIESFKIYLEKYCALTFVELLESEQKHKEAIRLRPQIEKAVHELLAGAAEPVQEPVKEETEKPKAPVKRMKLSKEFVAHMDKKFNIKKRSKSNVS